MGKYIVRNSMRVISEGAEDLSLHGDGWELITEDKPKQEMNPELEKLKDLL